VIEVSFVFSVCLVLLPSKFCIKKKKEKKLVLLYFIQRVSKILGQFRE